jgi:hypothetical protein
VAKKAIEHLSDDLGSSDPNPKTPEDDWLNVFERYAENASSEKLRDLWGRVLAKEIRKPKSFSLRTMRFVSELDVETAAIFEKHSKAVIDGAYILKSDSLLEGKVFTELLALEDAGLLAGVDGSIAHSYRSEEQDSITLVLRRSAVHVAHAGPIDIDLPVIILTNVGKEILRIVDPSDDLENACAVAENFPHHGGVTSVKYGRLNDERSGIMDSVTVWELPPPEAPAGQ